MLRRFGSKEERGRVSGRVLLRLMRFVRPYWLQMCAATLLVFIASGAGLLAPYLTKVAIYVSLFYLYACRGRPERGGDVHRPVGRGDDGRAWGTVHRCGSRFSELRQPFLPSHSGP
jgi:hypothetical protein